MNFAGGKLALIAALSFLGLTTLAAAEPAGNDAWPRYPELPPLWSYDDEFPNGGGAGGRFRLLGPVFERRSFDDAKLSYCAFRPLWSRQDDPDGLWSMDFVWPLSAWRDSWYVNYQWVLLYFGSRDPDGSQRQYLIPVWFCGTDKERKFYWGLFPLYGDVKNLIGYDRQSFVLWPLYWHTEKNGLKGEAYVWPLVNMESGPRSDKFRAFPFYAYNDVYGKYYGQAFLWPIVSTAKSQNDSMPGQGWMVWPFYGRNTYGERSSWSVLWPLILHSNRGDAGSRTHAPWPLVQYAKNYQRDGEWTLFLWPFWGQRLLADENFQFYVFPLGWYLEDRGELENSRWYYALPLYWTQVLYDKERKERKLLYRRFWPFASYYEEKDKASLRILDLWPTRRMEQVERNWGALWTLFDYEEKGRTGQNCNWDCLWGMLRGSSDGSGKGTFLFAPFYCSRWGYESEVVEGEMGFGVAEREYFFGLVKTKTGGPNAKLRLFWLFDLEI